MLNRSILLLFFVTSIFLQSLLTQLVSSSHGSASNNSCCTNENCTASCTLEEDNYCFILSSTYFELPTNHEHREAKANLESTFGCDTQPTTFLDADMCEIFIQIDDDIDDDNHQFLLAYEAEFVAAPLSLECSKEPIITSATKIKINQQFVCCDEHRCNNENEEKIKPDSNKYFDIYFEEYYTCLHTLESSVNNVYMQVENCAATELDYDTSSYSDVCAYQISKVYTNSGCQCLALAYLIDSIRDNQLQKQITTELQEWLDFQLADSLIDLQMYGCAIDLECDLSVVHKRDIVNVSLNVEREAYFVDFQLFISFDEITAQFSYEEHIYDMIVGEEDGEEDIGEESVYVQEPQTLVLNNLAGYESNITVVFLNESIAELFVYYVNNVLFPADSSSTDNNHTVLLSEAELNDDMRIAAGEVEYYHGSKRVYPVKDREERRALIAGVVLTAGFCIVCVFLIYYYKCRSGLYLKGRKRFISVAH